MSRAGYVEADGDNDLQIHGYRANVRRMMRGRSGQAFLWELYLALEALPTKELIVGGLIDDGRCACALGAVALYRGIQIHDDLKVQYDEDGDIIEADDIDFYETVSSILNIKEMMAREIMYQNDECDKWRLLDGTPIFTLPYAMRDTPTRHIDTPSERYQRMRSWVVSRLKGIP